jgi:hypothetical protein
MLPHVRERSGEYTSRLEIAHFDGTKYMGVHQRSSALGSSLWSKQPDTLASIGDLQRMKVTLRHLSLSLGTMRGEGQLD